MEYHVMDIVREFMMPNSTWLFHFLYASHKNKAPYLRKYELYQKKTQATKTNEASRHTTPPSPAHKDKPPPDEPQEKTAPDCSKMQRRQPDLRQEITPHPSSCCLN